MKWLRRGFLGLAALSLALLWLVATLGAGGESQFCPATLEHRGVSVCSIPYTNVAVWTNPGEPYRPRIVQFWFDEGYARASGLPERWHVITGWAPWIRGGSGPAKVFWYCAGCRSDEEADEWIAWSRRHPALAADLWPRVVGLLRQAGTDPQTGERYWEASMLMVTVRGAKDEPTYRARIATWDRRCAEERAK